MSAAIVAWWGADGPGTASMRPEWSAPDGIILLAPVVAATSAHGPQDGGNAVYATALNGCAETAGVLLDHGADINSAGYVSLFS